MGGPRLTPEQVETASEIFARTNNVSEAARAIGVSESTLRTHFDRDRTARNREAHARACEEGLQRGLTWLLDVAEKCHATLTGEIRAGEGLDAKDIAGLGRAVTGALTTVMQFSERDDRRRLSKRQRKKLRAETLLAIAQTKAIDVKAQAGMTPEDLLSKLSVDELLAVLATIRAKRAASAKEPTADKV